jgi:type IV pilus assembly protein PilA
MEEYPQMIERLRRRREQQKGFTLIELLVVVIIIGLLAAIAIPAFMGQRDKANDAVAKSLVRNTATAVEAAFVDTQAYDDITETMIEDIEPNIDVNAAALATDDQVSYTSTAANSYSLSSISDSGITYTMSRATDGTISRTTTVADGADAGTDPDPGLDW